MRYEINDFREVLMIDNPLPGQMEIHLAHGVNCMGRMRSGIAAIVRAHNPVAYNMYKDFVDMTGEGNTVLLGQAQKTRSLENGVTLWNMFTQWSYGRDPSKRYVNYEAVAKSFENLANEVELHQPIRFPLIGAGLGNGDWDIISMIIDKALHRHTDVACIVRPEDVIKHNLKTLL